MLTVKNIQIENKQAQKALTRINKILKEIYGDKIPDPKTNEPAIGSKILTVQNSEPINVKVEKI